VDGLDLEQSHEALVRIRLKKWEAFKRRRTGRHWACSQGHTRPVRTFSLLGTNDEEEDECDHRQKRDSTENAANNSTDGHATPCRLVDCDMTTGGHQLCIAIVKFGQAAARKRGQGWKRTNMTSILR